MLDGSGGEIKIQVGSQDNETISLNLSKLDAGTLNLGSFSVAKAVDPANLSADIANGAAVVTGSTSSFAFTDSNTGTPNAIDGKVYEDGGTSHET